jgi:O-antigen/teichoic acid export membrane protein
LKKFHLTSSAILILGVLGALTGYIFQIFLGRSIEAEDLGVYTVLISVLSFLMIPITSYGMVVTRNLSEVKSQQKLSTLEKNYFNLYQFSIFYTLLVLLILIISKEHLLSWLHVKSSFQVTLIFLFILLNAIFVINHSILQAEKKFLFVASLGFFGNASKIFFCCVAFFLFKNKLDAIFISLAFSSIFIFCLSILPILKHFSFLNFRLSKFFIRINFFNGLIPCFFASCSFLILSQFDIIIVNHYFSLYEVGIYSIASIIGKAILLLPTSISLNTYPEIVENHSKGSPSKYLIINALVFTLIISIFFALICFYFSDSIIALFFNNKYSASSSILKWYGFCIMPIVLIITLEYFIIAKNKLFFTYLILFMSPLVFLFAHLFHDNLFFIIFIMGIFSTLLLFFGVLILAYLFYQEK